MATSYSFTSAVEFDYSYTGSLATTNYLLLYSAFGSSSAITTVSLLSTFAPAGAITFNAGAYADVVDKYVSGAANVFYLGASSTAASSSIYTKSANTLTSGATTGGPNDTASGYGTFEFAAGTLTAASTVSFVGAGNTLILDSGTTSPATLTNFDVAGDQIVLAGDAYSASGASITGYVATSATTGILTYVNGGVASSIALSFTDGSTVTAANFAVASKAVVEGGNSATYSGDVVISYVPCFLRGTLIATATGEVPVEHLRAGDLVTVMEQGLAVQRPVRWAGGSTMRVADHEGRDEAHPVRVRADAFGPGRPLRDLLVTPEHCLVTGAGLVPARMLVNGSSILVDRTITEYEFFHIELDRHGILLSDGLETESYLDSGHRTLFEGAVMAEARRPGQETALPLALSRDLVEPIWRSLAERGTALFGSGPASAMPAAATDEPDLRLLLDDGTVLAACMQDRLHHMFRIPRDATPVRLLSRSAVPSEAIGPFVDDRRRLGVAVNRLVLWDGLDQHALEPDTRSGWYGSENGVRWTNGDAALDMRPAGAETFLDVHLAATMRYQAAVA